MSGTVRLNAPLIAEAQASKYVTHNDGLQAIEDALQGALAVSVASGDATLTDADFRSALLFAISGASVGGREVALPADIERLVVFSLDDASAHSVDVAVGSNTATVSPGEAILVRTDGAGNIAVVMRSATAYATEAQATFEAFPIAVSDEATALTTGAAKITFRMPFAMTLSSIRGSLGAASSSGVVTVDVNVNGSSILSTKLTIDASEKTSLTAATPAVISSASIADDDEVTIDIDAAGTDAKGLKVTLIGAR